jgi:WD40 repeat protein
VLIASSFADCSFRFYNFNGKTELSLREAVPFHNSLVTCLHHSDDNVLATADQEGVVAVWDLDFNGTVLGSLRRVLRTQSIGVRQVTISQLSAACAFT